jgi:tetratricopeptide (TPR) repeat protein
MRTIPSRRRSGQDGWHARMDGLMRTAIALAVCAVGVVTRSALAGASRESVSPPNDLIVLVTPIRKEEESLKTFANRARGNTRSQVAPFLEQVRSVVASAEQDEQRAAAAKNPQVREVYRRSAMEKLEYAREWGRRVEMIVSPVETPAQTVALRSSPGPRSRCGSGAPALMQLCAWNARDQSEGGYLAGNESADNLKYDRSNQTITLPSGQAYSVEPLARGTGDPRAEVFRPTRAPDGKVMYQLSPEAMQVSQEVLQGKSRGKLGGVALAVTVDTLAFSGVSGLRLNGLESVIRRPVLISLKRLTAEAASYLRSAGEWDRLPGKLRYPGDVNRIYGYVIDRKRGDVFLVGSRTDNPAERISLDSLIIGARSVWRDGNVPAVSLDMDPRDPGGPQTVRVIGIPLQSQFAKIMLEADYAMKKIIFGELNVGVPGFARINAMMARQTCRTGRFTNISRFWLTPAPLEARDIHLSPSGRTLLFSTAIRDQTEAMRAAGATLVGTGQTGGFAVQSADLFTRQITGLERSKLVHPLDIYARLHGLVDIVTVYSLLRRDEMGFPMLKNLAALPLPELSGTQTVPAFYPGISEVVARYPMLHCNFELQGGVLMRDQARMAAYDPYQDIATLDLEHAVDTFPKGVIALDLNQRFFVPQVSTLVDGAEQSVEDGERFMAAGDLSRARASFRKAISIDPFMGAAWADRALAELRSGDSGAASSAAQRALALNPLDQSIRTVALEVQVAARPSMYARGHWDAPARKAAAEDYVTSAMIAYEHGALEAAQKDADDALLLSPGDPSAYLARSYSYTDIGGPDAERDRQLAIDAYRARLAQEPDASMRRSLADALVTEASLRMSDVMAFVGQLSGGQGGNLAPQLDTIERLVNQAALADPAVPGVSLVRAEVVFIRDLKRQVFGLPTNFQPAYELVRRIMQKNPDYAPAYATLAQLSTLTGQYPLALKAINKASRLDPQSVTYQIGRAELEAATGHCAAAHKSVTDVQQEDLSATPLARFKKLLRDSQRAELKMAQLVGSLCH